MRSSNTKFRKMRRPDETDRAASETEDPGACRALGIMLRKHSKEEG
jgi:hypothetical protein